MQGRSAAAALVPYPGSTACPLLTVDSATCESTEICYGEVQWSPPTLLDGQFQWAVLGTGLDEGTPALCADILCGTKLTSPQLLPLGACTSTAPMTFLAVHNNGPSWEMAVAARACHSKVSRVFGWYGPQPRTNAFQRRRSHFGAILSSFEYSALI